MFGFSKKTALKWTDLTDLSQLPGIEEESHKRPVLILKHSTRCSISDMAKNRLELYWENDFNCKPYYLDLLSYREISNELASRYHITHQSPQIIVLKNGVPVYSASHSDIDYNTLKRTL